MSRKVNAGELSPIERLTYRVEMAEAGVRELRGRQNELERQWGQFVPIVSDQIGRNIISPILQQSITLPDSLDINELKDPLNLRDWRTKEQRGKGYG